MKKEEIIIDENLIKAWTPIEILRLYRKTGKLCPKGEYYLKDGKYYDKDGNCLNL